MTLAQLRAFLLSSRGGTFAAAARELQMTQASVSELVRRLEEEVGVELFVRAGRRLVLTGAGDELAPFAAQAVTASEAGAAAVRALRTLDGGTTSFGLLRNADYYLLSPLAQRFAELHPRVRARFVGLNSVEVAAAVTSGELEAGLVVLPVDHEGLQVRPLVRDEVVYVSADPSHLVEPVTVHQLAAASTILYDAHYGDRDPTRRQVAERALAAGVRVRARLEVEHVEAALKLAAAGLGDTFACRAVVASPAFPPGVGVVPFADPLHDTIALIHRSGAVLTPATREIVRLARRMLSSVGEVL